MLKVLLAIEDYNELLYNQTLLKKLGFQVDGIRSDRGFEETFLRLNPDVAIFALRSRKTFGLDLLERVKKHPFTILLVPNNSDEVRQFVARFHVDLILENPVKVPELLETLAHVAGVDKNVILAKYEKIRMSLVSKDDTIHTATTTSLRTDRMKNALKTLQLPKTNGYDKAVVQRVTQQLHIEELLEDTKNLEDERQAFVKALFKAN